MNIDNSKLRSDFYDLMKAMKGGRKPLTKTELLEILNSSRKKPIKESTALRYISKMNRRDYMKVYLKTDKLQLAVKGCHVGLFFKKDIKNHPGVWKNPVYVEIALRYSSRKMKFAKV